MSTRPAIPRTRRRRRRTRRGVSSADLRLERFAWPLAVLLALVAAIVFAPKLILLATDERALIAEAEASLDAGNLAEAEDAVARALEKRPGDGEAHLMQARIDIARRDGAAATMAIDRAVAAGLPGERVHAHLGAARILTGDWRGADEALHARVAERDLGLANRLLATLAMRRGDRAEARGLLDLARDFDPDSADLWVDYAELYRRSGEMAAARQAARRAIHIDAGNVRALIVGARLAAQINGPAAALPFLERGLARVPGDQRLLELKAKALAEMGRYKDMLAVSLEMLAREPDSASAHYLLAWLAARADKDALAHDLLDRAAVRMGDAPPYLLLAGIVDYRLGRYREATERFEALLKAQPDNKRARQLLAASYLKLDEAGTAWRAIEPLANDPLANGYTRQLAARIRAGLTPEL